ncbi:MAG: adenylosuccinate synthase [Bacteroidales bacterium]|nr:adenylosuccinate synthase [Bacteroidales bacterium]MDD4684791.1 adenylosuccinate synthase [Bacteroidales bacterium]
MNKIDVLLGLQWGDEGKGKIVDVLTPQYDIIARFQGGPNAGHTLEFQGTKHVLNIIPSGIFHSEKQNIIGNGVLIEPLIFQREIRDLKARDVNPNQNLFVSKKAHLITPSHRMLDMANEQAKGLQKIGSTLKGIGPTYTDKIARIGLRVGDILKSDWLDRYNDLKEDHLRLLKSLGYDLGSFKIDEIPFLEYERRWMESLETLKTFTFIDSEYFLNDALKQGKKILAEGAQGSMLDIDFGSYPFVTSSSTITAGVCSGLGIAPSNIGRVYGLCKAYCTRVGSGPFPTELFDETGDRLRQAGREFGSTTGRPRRCGWIDIPALNYACMLNGVTDLVVTKVDVMNDFDTVKMCVKYKIEGKETLQIPYDLGEKIEPILQNYQGWNSNLQGIKTYNELPSDLKDYIKAIEDITGVKVAIVSTSPDREDTIFKI